MHTVNEHAVQTDPSPIGCIQRRTGRSVMTTAPFNLGEKSQNALKITLGVTEEYKQSSMLVTDSDQ